MANEKYLTSRDLSVIVKACGKAGVKTFSFGDLTITFGTETPKVDHVPSYIHYASALSEEQNSSPTTTTSTPSESEVPSEDLDLLSIVNPIEWERRGLKDDSDV